MPRKHTDILLDLCALSAKERRLFITALLQHSDCDMLAASPPPSGVLDNLMRDLQTGLVGRATSGVSQVVKLTIDSTGRLDEIHEECKLGPYKNGPRKRQAVAA